VDFVECGVRSALMLIGAVSSYIRQYVPSTTSNVELKSTR